MVVATLPQAAEALQPLFPRHSQIRVPRLHSHADAVDALRSSAALNAILHPEAVDGAAERALTSGPIGVRPLYELVESACSAADDGGAAAQLAAGDELLGL